MKKPKAMIQITSDGCELICENFYISDGDFLAPINDESRIILDGLSMGVTEMAIREALKLIENSNLELGKTVKARAKRITVWKRPST